GDVTFHAYSYSGGVMTDLGTLGGLHSLAYAINSGGTVVGESNDGNGVIRGFSYSGGVMTNLGSLGGGTFDSSHALGINSSGTIVGNSTTATASHAFSYSGGIMTDLG